MTFQHKENSGTLFKNNKKENERQPDYRGEVNVNGELFQIAAWVKEGKNGKFFSLSVKEPYQKDEAQTHKGFNRDGDVPSGRDEENDFIPF